MILDPGTLLIHSPQIPSRLSLKCAKGGANVTKPDNIHACGHPLSLSLLARVQELQAHCHGTRSVSDGIEAPDIATFVTFMCFEEELYGWTEERQTVL